MKKIVLLSPFILPLLSLAVGIYIQSCVPSAAYYFLIGFCALFCILIFTFPRYPNLVRIHTIVLNGLFLCAGGIVLHLQHQHTNLLAAQFTNRPLTLLAKITDKHIQVASKPRWKQDEILELAVTEVQNASEQDPASQTTITQTPIPASFNLQCFVKHTTTVQVGDTILIKNITIKPPQHQTLSGNPGYADYLLKEGFLSSIFLSNDNKINIINHPTWTLRRLLWELRNNNFQMIMKQLSPCTASYYSLIFLGKKDPEVTDQLRRTFNYWGLSHYLARSGIHIVLFILIWKFILSFLPIHLVFKRILLIVICGSYGLLSWASTPFIRAYYSFLLTEGGRLFGLHVHFFHMLTIICTLMLLFNPLQLFFLDFQLTFGLTFALGWLSMYQQQNTARQSTPSLK